MKAPPPFPLAELLEKKDARFKKLFATAVNLFVAVNVGKPLSERDQKARIKQAIEESLKKE